MKNNGKRSLWRLGWEKIVRAGLEAGRPLRVQVRDIVAGTESGLRIWWYTSHQWPSRHTFQWRRDRLHVWGVEVNMFKQGWTLDHWLLIQETDLDLPHCMSPSTEMAWAYGDRSSWFAWDFPNVNTESPASRKSPQSLAYQVSWSPKPSPWPAHPAHLVTLQFCLPYGFGDPAFHSLQASELLADTAHTQAMQECWRTASPPSSLWSEAVKMPLDIRKKYKRSFFTLPPGSQEH